MNNEPRMSNAYGTVIDVNVDPVELPEKTFMFISDASHYDRRGNALTISGTSFAGSLPDDGMPPTVVLSNGLGSVEYTHPDNVGARIELEAMRYELENQRRWLLTAESDLTRLYRERKSSRILRLAYWLHQKLKA